MLDVALAVAVGIALAACAGLRAFLPMLAAGLLARFGLHHLHESFAWLSSTPALVALAVACAAEVAADKVPALDHALDVASTPLRTVAGVIVAASAFAPFPTWAALLLGIVAGGASLSVHATKATLRGASTATTAGVANPVLSVAEDVACAAGSVLAPLLAVVAVLIALVGLVATFFAARLIWRHVLKPRAGSA